MWSPPVAPPTRWPPYTPGPSTSTGDISAQPSRILARSAEEATTATKKAEAASAQFPRRSSEGGGGERRDAAPGRGSRHPVGGAAKAVAGEWAATEISRAEEESQAAEATDAAAKANAAAKAEAEDPSKVTEKALAEAVAKADEAQQKALARAGACSGHLRARLASLPELCFAPWSPLQRSACPASAPFPLCWRVTRLAVHEEAMRLQRPGRLRASAHALFAASTPSSRPPASASPSRTWP